MSNKYKHGKYRISIAGDKKIQNKVVSITDDEGNDALSGGSIDISGKADKVSSATSGNFAGLDANGNLTDSGKKASDFATASQGARADTAYQKPQAGIPESDLSSDVQQALQKHFKGWFNTLAELKAAHTAVEGDSAYVKDASPATTWSIYVYDATATTDNNWADSGTDADTSNVQTFASGEEVNEVHIVNDLTTGGADDVLSAEQGKVIGEELYGEEGYVDVELQLSTDSYYNCAIGSEPPYSVKTSPTSWPDSGMACAQIQVQAGDKFKIYGLGNRSSTVLYAFADASNYRLTYASNDVDYRTNGYEFTAPEGAARLVVNFKEYNSLTDKLQKWGFAGRGIIEEVEELDERVTALEETQNVKSVLQGKTIIAFGDSLTEFKQYGTTKTWCDYAAEISGATFINIGIGGTQLKSRVACSGIFDATKTYAVDDYVYHLDNDGHYHFYKCTTQNTGAWDASHFTELTNDAKMYVGLDIVNLITEASNTSVVDIDERLAVAAAAADCVKTNIASHDNNTAQITRLKAVDWSKVDAIIIMGGTNDFDGSSFGNSDSTVITSEAGAINIIVSQLSTSYGLKPIYFVKEPVKWFPETVDDARTYPDDHWCDVFTRGGMTLAQFFNQIEEQFNVVNHIPVCDLYYGLAWNKQNFWNYFRIESDGTHPYKGFRQVAEKISSFLIANKVF